MIYQSITLETCLSRYRVILYTKVRRGSLFLCFDRYSQARHTRIFTPPSPLTSPNGVYYLLIYFIVLSRCSCNCHYVYSERGGGGCKPAHRRKGHTVENEDHFIKVNSGNIGGGGLMGHWTLQPCPPLLHPHPRTSIIPQGLPKTLKSITLKK